MTDTKNNSSDVVRALDILTNAFRDCFDEEYESLAEGLMTDACLTRKDREAMRAQIDAIDVWKTELPSRARFYAERKLRAVQKLDAALAEPPDRGIVVLPDGSVLVSGDGSK